MLNNIKQDRYVLLVSFIFLFLFSLPFAIHGNYFVDDWLRSESGASGWEANGRPLASTIMALLSLSENYFGAGVVSDLFPSSLFAMSLMMLASGYLIADKLNIKNTFIKFIVIVLPTANQFWIGNLVFRFDSLIMSISYFMAILSVIVCEKKGFINYAISFTLIIAFLSTYQASMNVAISFSMISSSACLLFSNRDYCVKDFLLSASRFLSCLLIGYVFYQAIIVPQLNLSAYTIASGRMIEIDRYFLLNLLSNAIKYLDFLVGNFDGLMFWCVVISLIFSCIIPAYWLIRDKKYYASLISILIPFFLLIMSFGTLSLLQSVSLQSRVFMSFSMCIIYSAYIADLCGKKVLCAPQALIVLLSLMLSSVVSNIVNDTQRYDRFIAERIANRLYENGYRNGDHLIIYGSPAGVPSVYNLVGRHPSLWQYSVSAFSNQTFKYSLMRQYNIRSTTPTLTMSNKYYDSCGSVIDQVLYEDEIFKMCRVENNFIVKLKRF
ncbi:glucosyltransferase domain-containing protein [Kosakonia cowanii]|uniref:glucosyltransferase domain-containing protein n=1 Tax=Kosakonia cowanii TaxID=208223 RepID=UPI0028ADA003|nr:glucosyltransferase domain-containing protein [Kosakonia cowanii]